MSPEKQRISIAELCGWLRSNYRGCTVWESPEQQKMPNPSFSMPDEMPDYLNDLNAMAQAEERLNPSCNDSDIYEEGNAQRYEHELIYVLKDVDPFQGADLGDLWHASAKHRAEAFLKACNKWEDS